MKSLKWLKKPHCDNAALERVFTKAYSETVADSMITGSTGTSW